LYADIVAKVKDEISTVPWLSFTIDAWDDNTLRDGEPAMELTVLIFD
jgi:S-methylmethionine-dependent homocysteine/selenocysteine methylase